MCGEWTRYKLNQSDGNYSNIIPNDNVLGVLLLPWFEYLHLGIVVVHGIQL